MVEIPESRSSGASSAIVSRSKLSWYRDWLLILTISSVVAVDQLTKYLVKTNLRLGESWPAEGLIRLTHGTNTGSAFGLFTNQTPMLIVASIVAITFLIYFYRTHALPRRLLRVAIGLQLGGAVGNLTDRLLDGAVVDFIDVGWWPIFNIADSSIMVGLTVLIGVLVLGDVESSPRAGVESGVLSGSEDAGR